MRHVWLWVTRPDGQIEQHIGPIGRFLRTEDGRATEFFNEETGRKEAVPDEEFVNSVYELVKDYDGKSAGEVAMAIKDEDLTNDETGALRYVAEALLQIARRVTTRQQRADQNRQRAEHLANYELETMTVHVRAE